MTEWLSTWNNEDQWLATWSNEDQWLTSWVEYVFEATLYNLVAKEISYYLEAENNDFYFVANDATYYIEGE